MKIINCEQRSDEWYKARQLKMTASNADKIIGTGLKGYIQELVCEYLTGHKEEYTNADMQRGVLLEEQARTYCSLLTGKDWQEVGFVEYSDYVGVSPDGLILVDNNIQELVEIKCPSDKVFFEQLITDKIPLKYFYQMNMQMLCCNCNQCTYFAYNQNIYPNYFHKVIQPDAEIQEKLKAGIEKGTELIEQYLKDYNLIIESEE